ncbi:hypothetical protein BaRGS_00034179, partial [Batillaria attramentaria]
MPPVTSNMDARTDITSRNTSARYKKTVISTQASIPITSPRSTLEAGAKKELELHFTSNVSGYIQTPGWNENGETTYFSHMKSVVQVEVPHNHKVLISIHHVDIEASDGPGCAFDSLVLYARFTQFYTHTIWNVCGSRYPSPELFGARTFFVEFVTDRSTEMTGFRLHFSFHEVSALPEQLPGGKWNCSGQNWVNFQQHFLCNLVTECAGAEDEQNCSYATDLCGPGLISVAGGCYSLVLPYKEVTWDEASRGCLSREQRLASLNTFDKWRDVTALLQKYKYDGTFVGLKEHFGLPLMYSGTWQWTDNTIGYFYDIRRHIERPGCAVISKEHNDPKSYILQMKNCGTETAESFLCEVEIAQDRETSVPEIPCQDMTIFTSVHNPLECPDGHVTHTMLACDLQAACWAQYPNGCDAPLTQLPPSFECSSGIARVPYTLVCDFRPDCSDASDETFCVVPPCHPILEFDCRNKQCIPQKNRCDDHEECVNAKDEVQCPQYTESSVVSSMPPPAIITFNGRGSFTIFSLLSNLKVLSLAGNPLTDVFSDVTSHASLPSLRVLDLSRIQMTEMDVSALSVFPRLWTLNLSGNGIETFESGGFQTRSKLREVDLRGSPMTLFPEK